MIQRISEVESPTVGEFYLVPTIFNPEWRCAVPIYGPKHSDKEFLDFPHQHWHIDWRFAGIRFYHQRLATRKVNHIPQDHFLHGIVANEDYCTGEIVERRLRMKREMPDYPRSKDVPWMKKLEEAYAFHRLPKCLTCPHKGISLKHVKPDARGVITCTGHGLSWNRNTGFLVRST